MSEEDKDKDKDKDKCLICKVEDETKPGLSSSKKDTGDDEDDDEDTAPVSSSGDKVPTWSKKVGNYSPYPKVLTCDSRFSLESRGDLEAQDPDIEDTGISVKLDLGPGSKGSWVFGWAPMPSKGHLTIANASEAYQGDINHCLQKTNEKGQVILRLNCPQPYQVDGVTYCRHIHYAVENVAEGIWMPMKTRRVICQITLEDLDEVLKKKTALVINSLPPEMYEKDKIPKSLNLPRETLDKLTHGAKKKRVLAFLKDHLKDYPPIQKQVQGQKLALTDIPIVIYCYNNKCKSSARLLKHFYEVGVNNVLEWSEGVKGWQEERIFFDESSAEDEDDESDEPSSSEEDDEDDEDDEDESIDYEPITFEDVEYTMVPKTKEIIDDKLDVLGTARMVGKVCKGIEWAKGPLGDEAREAHEATRDELLSYDKEEETNKEKKKEVKVKTPPEKEKKQEVEVKVKTPSDEDDESSSDEDDEAYESDGDESDEEDDDETDEEEDELYTSSKSTLEKKSLVELKAMMKGLLARPGSSYTFGPGSGGPKTKDEIMGLITSCQGKPTKVKGSGPYQYLKPDELRQKSLSDLKNIVAQMTARDPAESKLAFSRWRKGQLVGFIIGCRGRPSPKDKTKAKGVQKGGQKGHRVRGKSKNNRYRQRGWGFSF